MTFADSLVHERNDYIEHENRIRELGEMKVAVIRDATFTGRARTDELDRLNQRIALHLHKQIESENRLRVLEDKIGRGIAA